MYYLFKNYLQIRSDLQNHQRDSHQHHEPGRRWLSIQKYYWCKNWQYSSTQESLLMQNCLQIRSDLQKHLRDLHQRHHPRAGQTLTVNTYEVTIDAKFVCTIDVIFRGTCEIPISTITNKRRRRWLKCNWCKFCLQIDLHKIYLWDSPIIHK